MEAMHVPVLVEETIHWLAPRKGGELMVDSTLGEGGHSYAFLSRFPELNVIGVDVDPIIQEIARERLKVFGERIRFHSGWAQDFFRAYPKESRRPDTILIDLGISLFHYEKSGRGFSFRKDEALDMRLDPLLGPGAAELIATLGERELADLLYANAEERYSRRIAGAIVEARRRGALRSSRALGEVVEQAVPPSYRNGPLHPATKTFLALRIAVNGELARLRDLLEAALLVLEPRGRLGVISFNSGEDRIVKGFFREQRRDCTHPMEAPIHRMDDCTVVLLNPRGTGPTEMEKRVNPPSRSARLRVVEKLRVKDES
ncbi:MAG: 16S rRNA (cytosine(1402)-N(4))-methyltransferase RsmH [Treponema sp.]|jgi:16S rRNA (cytosine1402-N4)-methyltransferase|nr:16S rRNA (cytosine(1402)-N(4))-methyltransferase RsmH [Treponema sp.]